MRLDLVPGSGFELGRCDPEAHCLPTGRTCVPWGRGAAQLLSARSRDVLLSLPCPPRENVIRTEMLKTARPSLTARSLQDVLHRHALYLIIRMVCYDDGLGAGKSLLALKTTDASNEEYSLWVYQCHSLVRLLSCCGWSLIPPVAKLKLCVRLFKGQGNTLHCVLNTRPQNECVHLGA